MKLANNSDWVAAAWQVFGSSSDVKQAHVKSRQTTVFAPDT